MSSEIFALIVSLCIGNWDVGACRVSHKSCFDSKVAAEQKRYEDCRATPSRHNCLQETGGERKEERELLSECFASYGKSKPKASPASQPAAIVPVSK